MTEAPSNNRRRVVAHFPGFEPLDAEAHRQRYARSSVQSGEAFGFSAVTHPLMTDGPAPHFEVWAHGPDWRTQTNIHILDHYGILTELKAARFHLRLWRGCRAAFSVFAEGAFTRYMKVSWRFGLFFLIPFVLMTLGLAGAALIGFMPLLLRINAWNMFWSFAVAAALFSYVFLPFAERAHTQHMFADWELAVKLAQLDDAKVTALIESHVTALAQVLRLPADEHLITSHSLGGSLAAHALGLVLERNAQEFTGKSIILVTLGGSGLQTSLLACAVELRARIGAILRSGAVFWIDVQCLTDMVNFYGSRVARDNGHGDLPEPAVQGIRIRNMLTPERYKRIKLDVLRVHRQFVLGSDRRTHYDFTLLTAGPFSARSFARFSPAAPPPLDENGAIVVQGT